MAVFLSILLVISGILLMFIILLQRGRGGGLAGAFGGAGGQSAFGTKAGDVFTKITAGMAAAWVILAGLTGFAMRSAAEGTYGGGSEAAVKSADDESRQPTTSPTEDTKTTKPGDEPDAKTDGRASGEEDAATGTESLNGRKTNGGNAAPSGEPDGAGN